MRDSLSRYAQPPGCSGWSGWRFHFMRDFFSRYAHDLSGYARPDNNAGSDIQRGDVQGVLFDEFVAGLDLVAHKFLEDLVRVGLVPISTHSNSPDSGFIAVSESCSGLISQKALFPDTYRLNEEKLNIMRL
jgi:hypothetical protein